LESVAEPGASTPVHFHREDESFYVLEGTVTFFCEGQTFHGGPGTTVAIPAGARHAWRNRSSSQARMLVTFAPGGIEALFRDIGDRQPAEIAALAATFGTHVVGPPIQD
jgi:quercetin dioxygenase-like cupin family protein